MRRVQALCCHLCASQQPSEFTAKLMYISADTEPSLLRNGKVGTRRLSTGEDEGWYGISSVDANDMPMLNARMHNVSLAREGFELAKGRPIPVGADLYSENDILTKYYPDCEALVKQVTGASHAFAFDHNVRNAKKPVIKGADAAVLKPIALVHTDYTIFSAPERVQQLSKEPKINDTLRKILGDRPLIPKHLSDKVANGGRFMIVNVWRNIASEPIQRDPLGVCTADSFDAEQDLVTFEVHYPDRIGENYFIRPNPRHRWMYFPQMAPDEALVMLQWDSEGDVATLLDGRKQQGQSTFSFHSAFEDPTSPKDAPQRESIEVRCIVIF